jgi:hypothetical protein
MVASASAVSATARHRDDARDSVPQAAADRPAGARRQLQRPTSLFYPLYADLTKGRELVVTQNPPPEWSNNPNEPPDWSDPTNPPPDNTPNPPSDNPPAPPPPGPPPGYQPGTPPPGYPPGGQHPQGQPYPQGEQYPQGQPWPQGQQYPQGEQYPQGGQYPAGGQYYPQGAPSNYPPNPAYPYGMQQVNPAAGNDHTSLFGWLGIVLGLLCCAIIGVVLGVLSIRDARRFNNSPVLGWVAIVVSVLNAVGWTIYNVYR